jgi:excinuclease ABC subunit A
VVDRFKVRDDLALRLAESFETALKLADGVARIASMDDPRAGGPLVFSDRFACPICGYSLPVELEPRLFSFNNPVGACASCDGLGVKQFFDPSGSSSSGPHLSSPAARFAAGIAATPTTFMLMQSLAGTTSSTSKRRTEELAMKSARSCCTAAARTRSSSSITSTGRGAEHHPTARLRRHPAEHGAPLPRDRIGNVREELASTRPAALPRMRRHPPESLRATRVHRRPFVAGDHGTVDPRSVRCSSTRCQAGRLARRDHRPRSSRRSQTASAFWPMSGWTTSRSNRSADTLSGGEAQRIRLASQIGSGLVGVMYILDEPSIGLHQRDNEKLLGTLLHLRDLGNTVIVVEHDRGRDPWPRTMSSTWAPGAGVHGGQVVAQGTPSRSSASPPR